MSEWVMVVVALTLFALSLLRSGWTRGIRDPLTYIAIGLTCGSLRGALRVAVSSTPGVTLFTAELAAVVSAFYFLWRRANPRGGNAG